MPPMTSRDARAMDAHATIRRDPTPMVRTATIVLIAALAAACGPRDRTAPPIVVQGAMEIEVRTLAKILDHPVEEHIEGWTFWKGTIDGYPVIVSKTLKGMTNAAAATALAAEHYHPSAIINQGTAGGHEPDLRVADIVVGVESVNLGSFKTGYRAAGRGSDFAEWVPLDLLRTDGSAGQDPQARRMRRFAGDERLIAAAKRAGPSYAKGRVVMGTIGSADVWNSEIDRIRRFHDDFGTT